MLAMNKRIFYSDNGVLTDLSANLNKYNAVSSQFDYIAGEDYIYIGARLPFNSIYFKMDSQNSNPSTMIIETWTGTGWEIVDDIIDLTQGFNTSGNVIFIPDQDSTWSFSDTDGGNTVQGLETVKINNLYWMRVSFSDDLTGGTSLLWIGSIFSDDEDLGAEFPDLVKPSVISAFKSGKTEWEEQHVRAAEVVIQDLQINRVIVDSGQILELEDLRGAAVQKCAEIIFGAFGDDFADQRRTAREEYQRRISNPAKKIDMNANGIEDADEKINTTGWLSR
jgi:hypothetical protein